MMELMLNVLQRFGQNEDEEHHGVSFAPQDCSELHMDTYCDAINRKTGRTCFLGWQHCK